MCNTHVMYPPLSLFNTNLPSLCGNLKYSIIYNVLPTGIRPLDNVFALPYHYDVQ